MNIRKILSYVALSIITAVSTLPISVPSIAAHIAANKFSTTIATITAGAGQTSMTLTSATGAPTLAAGDHTTLIIDAGGASEEVVDVTAISGTTVTMSATANSHSAGQTVKGSILTVNALAQLKQDAITTARARVDSTTETVPLNSYTIAAPTSAGITKTIPDGTRDGQFVRIRVRYTATKLVTLSTAAKINNATTRIVWAGEDATLEWDNANSTWIVRSGVWIPMICKLGMTSAQTLTAATAATLTFDTTVIDNTGLMANTGANKCVLQRPGIARVDAIIATAAGSGGSILFQTAIKQGSTPRSLGRSSYGAAGYTAAPTSALLVGAAADDITATAYNQSEGIGIAVGAGGTELLVTEVNPWWY